MMTLNFDSLKIIMEIDAWLDSMRQPVGYVGPVVHWWDDCLDFTGVGLDWRYEGIIKGYLNLWKVTNQNTWLEKAIRAGDDLVAGQFPSGNYRNSCFELNPNTCGTPHEAAADLGLLSLASALMVLEEQTWKKYFETAEKNLVQFYFKKLWDEDGQRFNDSPGLPSFVPNKSATLVEVLFFYAQLSGRQEIIPQYIVPTLYKILSFQLTSGELSGGIYQNSIHGKIVESCYPYYIARCIPGLVAGYEQLGDQKYLDAALAAGRFLLKYRYPDGSFPQVVYPKGRVNRYPQWVAPVGDILLALDILIPYGFNYDREPTLDWMLAGQMADGGFRTGVGFGKARFPAQKSDPRDDIACVGWVDKVFRYLITQLN